VGDNKIYSLNVRFKVTIMKKIISTTRLRDNLADALKKVAKEDFVLVTHRGKVKSAIVDIDYLEDLLLANNKEYLKSIKRAREDIKEGKVYTFDEVFDNI